MRKGVVRINSVAIVFLLTLAVLVVMICVLPVLVNARPPGHAHRHPSTTKLRNIGQALFAYSTANNDCFPPETDWERLLVEGGFLKNRDLISPESDGEGPDFIFTSIRPDQIFDSEVVLAYEDPTNFGPLDQTARTFVLFADCHVDHVLYSELSRKYCENCHLPDGSPLSVIFEPRQPAP